MTGASRTCLPECPGRLHLHDHDGLDRIGLEGRVDESARILMHPICRLWQEALPGIPLRGDLLDAAMARGSGQDGLERVISQARPWSIHSRPGSPRRHDGTPSGRYGRALAAAKVRRIAASPRPRGAVLDTVEGFDHDAGKCQGASRTRAASARPHTKV